MVARPALDEMTTLGTPLNWTSPEETLTTGTLKLGALLHGPVPAVLVTDPEICTSPDETLTTGWMLDPVWATDYAFFSAIRI